MNVRLVHFRNYGIGDPGWHAEYVITDDEYTWEITVKGPNVSGPTWSGDVCACQFGSAREAWRYARDAARRGAVEVAT